MKQERPLTPQQQNSLSALVTQAEWFGGYFGRQAARVMGEPANER